MNTDSRVDLPNDESWGHNYLASPFEDRIHYVRKGKGKPVLLLHGWPGFWYDWRYVIPIVSKFVDVIAPDFRGFGDSDRPIHPPLDSYTPEAYAADLVHLLDQLGIEEVTVAAHDIGATVAQYLAMNYPERIKALVLLNPPMFVKMRYV